MIRAVVDTNVLVSGVRRLEHPTSPPGRIFRSWIQGRYELIMAEAILDEFRTTMEKPYFSMHVPRSVSIEMAERLATYGTLVEVVPPVPKIATHWQDDLVLAAALAGDANYLVTGDGELLAIGAYGDTSIVTVNEFVSILDAADND